MRQILVKKQYKSQVWFEVITMGTTHEISKNTQSSISISDSPPSEFPQEVRECFQEMGSEAD